jgi:hypothetical protein
MADQRGPLEGCIPHLPEVAIEEKETVSKGHRVFILKIAAVEPSLRIIQLLLPFLDRRVLKIRGFQSLERRGRQEEEREPKDA